MINKNRGFTLIELVTVILILAVLAVVAAPRFINFEEEAIESTHLATYAAFKAGISDAHMKWLAEGHSGPVEEFNIYPGSDKNIDMNASGWPAQSWTGGPEASPKLDNSDDCRTVWNQVLAVDSPQASQGVDKEYQAFYRVSRKCKYQLVINPTLKVQYDSNNGTVTHIP